MYRLLEPPFVVAGNGVSVMLPTTKHSNVINEEADRFVERGGGGFTRLTLVGVAFKTI